MTETVVKLSPVAVTVEMPLGHLKAGQEVQLIFHAPHDRIMEHIGFVLEALGGKLSQPGYSGGDVICQLTLVKDVEVFSPAHIRDGRMCGSGTPFTRDGY